MTPYETEAWILDSLGILGYALAGLVAGIVTSLLILIIFTAFRNNHPKIRFLQIRLRKSLRFFLMVLGFKIGLSLSPSSLKDDNVKSWYQGFDHTLYILLIIISAFMINAIIAAIGDAAVDIPKRQRQDSDFRRVRTQMQIISKVLSVVVWICALATALLSFTEFRALGTSLFASAGLFSFVAGLAAKTSLASIFAGMQIAFSDALRVGDLLVLQVGGETAQGVAEEITLTYVVVRTWDDRRLIIPSEYFISHAFENWSRREPKLQGTVEFDLDWLTPIEAMRIELNRIVQNSPLWDGRNVSLQITDTINSKVRVRAVVSAASPGSLFQLRCDIREKMINWLQHDAIYALPRTRIEPNTSTAPPLENRDVFIEETKKEWEKEVATQPVQGIRDDDDSIVNLNEPKRSWWRALLDQHSVATNETKPNEKLLSTTEIATDLSNSETKVIPAIDSLVASQTNDLRTSEDNPGVSAKKPKDSEYIDTKIMPAIDFDIEKPASTNPSDKDHPEKK